MSLTVSASGITFDDLTTLSTASISSSNLAVNSVGTLQLSAGAVTSSKIASGVSLVGSLSGTLTAGGALKLATAQNTTTGTSIDFTDIPSWVNRITVMFNGVATSGSSQHVVRLGTSSGFVATGYASYWGYVGASSATAAATDGFGIWSANTADTKIGHMIITRLTGNTWISSNSGGFTNGVSNFAMLGGGTVTLSGTLDRLRITTQNGTDTFRLGNVNIMYEG